MSDDSGARQYRHGRGSDEQHKQDQKLFSKLLEQHKELQRTTEFIERGIATRTTSTNPELVKTLQEHVRGMEKRFGLGRAIRSWDPLFAALFEYKDQISMEYHDIEEGIEVTLTSDNPKVIELIHCHDQTLHGFIKEGYEAGGRESPKPDWLN